MRGSEKQIRAMGDAFSSVINSAMQSNRCNHDWVEVRLSLTGQRVRDFCTKCNLEADIFEDGFWTNE